MGDHSAIQRSKVLIYPTTSQNCRSIMLDTEDIQYGILFIWNSRKGETNKQHQIVVVGWGIRRKECKGVQGNVSGWSKYFISWLWQWLHGDKHLSILIKPYILNSAMLLYVNYTSINLIKKELLATLSDRSDYTIWNIREDFIKIKIPQAWVTTLHVCKLRRASKWTEAKTDSIKRRNRQIHHYTLGISTCFYGWGQVENQ